MVEEKPSSRRRGARRRYKKSFSQKNFPQGKEILARIANPCQTSVGAGY